MASLISMDSAAAQALIRFGLGRRGSEAAPADPRKWLLDQLDGPDPGLTSGAFRGLPTATQALRTERAEQIARKRAIAAHAGKLPKPFAEYRREYFRDAAAQLHWASVTDAPFRERLVWFWTNHFTVSIRQGGTLGLVGPYVREAIRPHVTGRFEDMVLAVMRHPAMLRYLDNAGSVGPDSPAGRRFHRGLNENLARECMELHTVSLAAHYTQADVTNMARILTGWSVNPARSGGFMFRPFAHEPGSWTVLGHRFPPGEQGGIAALRFLANHPSTHHELAVKLTRHFIADDPPADAVAHVEGVLRDTRGDLKAASAALVGLPAAWRPLAKLRTPLDYVVASARALDLPPGQKVPMLGILRALGQPLWAAPLPNGWADTAAAWSASDAIMRRVDWAYAFSGRAGHADPAELAQANLGPLLRPAVLTAIHRAASRRDGVTMLLTSPEFQRR